MCEEIAFGLEHPPNIREYYNSETSIYSSQIRDRSIGEPRQDRHCS